MRVIISINDTIMLVFKIKSFNQLVIAIVLVEVGGKVDLNILFLDMLRGICTFGMTNPRYLHMPQQYKEAKPHGRHIGFLEPTCDPWMMVGPKVLMIREFELEISCSKLLVSGGNHRINPFRLSRFKHSLAYLSP